MPHRVYYIEAIITGANAVTIGLTIKERMGRE